jgi:hypothetical protein
MSLSLLLDTSAKQVVETSSGSQFADPENKPTHSLWYKLHEQEKPSVESKLSPWEVTARNDLESFLWVMIYAFCSREMTSRPNDESVEGREWYLRERFIPVFGAVSFRETYSHHQGFVDSVLNAKANDAAKANYIPHASVWVVLHELMTCSTAGKLDHATFKGILEHFIMEEEKFIAAKRR